MEVKKPAITAGPGNAWVISAMSFALIALAFSSIIVTNLERSSVPPLAIAFYRMALATALLAPAAVALKWREMRGLVQKDLMLLVVGGLCLAVHFGAWITSLKYIPIATSVVLVNSHPVFVVIASYVFLKEKPSGRTLIGMAVTLGGMLIICQDGLKDVRLALAGDGLAILGALAVVGYLIVGRRMRARISLLGYVTPLYAVCAMALLAWSIADKTPLLGYGAREWLLFLALAIVPTIFGHTIFNWAIKHVRPSAISVAFLGEPVIASGLAFLFFAQRPPAATLIGGTLVLVGIYFTTSSSTE